jgi:hypothetical protein
MVSGTTSPFDRPGCPGPAGTRYATLMAPAIPLGTWKMQT